MRRTASLVTVAALFAAAALVVAIDGSNESERFEADAATSGWTALRPAPLARTEVAAARIGRFIYVVGGFVPGGNATSAAVERYDITRNRWRREPSMPLTLNHPAAASYRGRLYVLGGYTANAALSGESRAFLRYSPRTRRWSRMPSAPSARAALAVGVIGDRLYAAGGADKGAALNRLEVFDFARRRWATGPPMPTPREHLAGAVAGGRFYVLAGRAAGKGNFDVAERYDPRTRRWQQLPAMAKPRGGIAAAAVRGRIVVFGGEEQAGTIAEVELFDPATRRWSRLPSMRTPRHGLGGVSLGRRVFAVEGGPTPGFDFSNAIEALDLR